MQKKNSNNSIKCKKNKISNKIKNRILKTIRFNNNNIKINI